jgi:rod shape-determining protein MreC
MTVVNDAGLVGRVTAVSGGTARVLLAVDPKSAVGTRLTGSGELGISRGNGRAPMRLQLLDPQASVQVGDQLTTGPYGATTYTPGVPIGRVAAVTDGGDGLVRTARVRPYVDFTALDVVAVVIAGPERGSTR